MVKSAVKSEVKVKAEKMPITNLVVLMAFKKTFSTGSTGFFGQVIDPNTGKKYQIGNAVEIGSNPNKVKKS